jgi:hypothetical protein
VDVAGEDAGACFAAGGSAVWVGRGCARTTAANTTEAASATALACRCWRRFTNQIVAD